jgi:hypothetical protein
MRFLIAGFLTLHGIAHLVGFLVPWRLITPADTPYKTTILAGHWNVGASGIRVVGVLWLLAALPFAAAAAGAVLRASWWPSILFGAAVASLVLCLASWPDSRVGVAVNVALLVALIVTQGPEWMHA